CGSPPPPAFPRLSPQWRLSDGGSPLTVARQLRFRTGFPWCPSGILAVRSSRAGRGESLVRPLARDPHREVKTVHGERQLDIRWRKARPLATHHTPVAVARPQRREEAIQVRRLAAHQALHVRGACVVFGVIGGSDERQNARVAGEASL